MTHEAHKPESGGEDKKPLDGLDYAIILHRRGGILDQELWEKRQALQHATSVRVEEDARHETIEAFRLMAGNFLNKYSGTIRVACANATTHFHNKNKKRNRGASEVERFFTDFLAALENIVRGDSLLEIDDEEIDDWSNTMTYFEILRQVSANAFMIKILTEMEQEWDPVHELWCDAKVVAEELQ